VPWFEILLTIVVVSGTLYAALSDGYNLPNRWFIRDDAYYYFKVAQNIGEGRGSTFDGIHLTNGYHPLWLLVCIPIFTLARFDLILPLRILAMLIGLLQLSTAIMIYRLIRGAISAAAGVLAASFWAFNSYVLVFLYKTGVESSISLFFMLLLLVVLCNVEKTSRTAIPLGRIAGLAVLAVLITFSRLDLIFVSLVFGIWIIFRGSPIRYLLPLDILALIVATSSAFLVRLGFPAYYDVANTVVTMLTASVAARIPLLYALGLYGKPGAPNPAGQVIRTLLATVSGSLIMAAVLWAGGALHLLPPVSRVVLLMDAGLSFAFLSAIRLAAYGLSYHSSSGADEPAQMRSAPEWRRWLTEGAIYFGILGGTLVAYMVWNQLGFGTFTPVSGQIKHWWGTFTHSIYGSSASNWLTFFAANPFSEFNAWAPPTTWLSDLTNPLIYKEGTGYGNPTWRRNFTLILLIAAIAVSFIAAVRRRRAVRALVQTSAIPLFVGSWLQVLGYNITGYASPKEWYWLTEPVFLVIAAAILVDTLIRTAFQKWRVTQVLVWILVTWYSGRGAFTYLRDAYYLSPYGLHPRGTPYSDIIPFLESNTEPGAVIGMTGGGNVGYLMPSRTIVNMDGLINSNEYFQDLQAGTAAEYLYNTGMRYVFANPTLLDANPYRGQFADRLKLLVNWGGKDLLRLLPKAGN
jgi:hypothetical protein